MKIDLLHEDDPYEGFDYKNYTLDLQGWGSTDPNFRKLIDDIQPKLIIEVGTWKGGSAIFMAEYIKEKNIDCKILCIDTWLGAVEFLTNHEDPDRYVSLGMKNGYPSVYYQFLANVMHKGLENIIIPFAQTSVLAARFLLLNNVQADMIFIDASHDEKDVYDDINNYWGLLKNGGVLFGDDYDEFWPGVKLAVNNFVADNDLDIAFTDRQWIVNKTKENLERSSLNIYQRSRENKQLALGYERDLFLYKTKFHDKESAFNNLLSSNQNLENEKNQLSEVNQSLENEKNQFHEINQKLENEKNQLIELNQSLENEKNQLIELNQSLENEKNQLNEINQKLENEKNQLSEVNQSLENEKNQFHEINQKLENEKNQLIELNQSLENEKNQLIELNQSLENEKNQLNEINQKLENEKNQLNEINQKLEDDKNYYCDKENLYFHNYMKVVSSKTWLIKTFIKQLFKR